MTCLEKYLQSHPNADPVDTIENACSHWRGIDIDKPDYCCHYGDDDFTDCTKCWNRELPGTEPDPTPVIKDSGSRHEFESGAVRDIQEGKGRCDLMPLDVVAQLLGGRDDKMSFDTILLSIDQFRLTGSVEHLYRAVEKFAQARFCDNCSMLLEVAIHYEEGAKKYGEYNWQKGLPVKSFINSAVRHYLKWLRGDKDEPHDRAFCWNVLCAIWTCERKPELNCYPMKTMTEE